MSDFDVHDPKDLRRSRDRAHAARAKALKQARAALDLFRRRQRQLAAATAGKSLGSRALHVAETLLNVREVGGNNAGPMVSKIIHANGGVGPEPWCGDFVAYCYRLAGSKSVVRAWASVNLLRRARGLKQTRDPKPGAIVIYNFDSDPDLEHTGLFKRWVVKGKTFLAVEGNTRAGTQTSDSGGGEGVGERERSIKFVDAFMEVTR